MAGPIRWGILGLGNIAHVFAQALTFVDGCRLVAVASRTQEKADEFARRHNVPRSYSSYEFLAADPEIDAIYIATPHSHHCENTLLCLDHGKHVVCEKAFAVTAAQARTMVAKARDKKLFLMEAMWTRFLPMIKEVRARVLNGEIGQLRLLRADFCFKCENQERIRLFAPHLAGGSLLDVGVYCLSLSSMFFGKPSQILSSSVSSAAGTDELNAIILSHPGGRFTLAASSFAVTTTQQAFITGTEGEIIIDPAFYRAHSYTLRLEGREPVACTLPSHENGFVYEIMSARDAILAGKLETDEMPLDESIQIIETMDTIRRQSVLKYPFE